MKRQDIAVVLALTSLFLVSLVFYTKFGSNECIIWIHSPELDLAGPQELEYKLLSWNKIVKSSVPSKNDKTIANEKLFLSGLSEYQNLNGFRYETGKENAENDQLRTDVQTYSNTENVEDLNSEVDAEGFRSGIRKENAESQDLRTDVLTQNNAKSLEILNSEIDAEPKVDVHVEKQLKVDGYESAFQKSCDITKPEERFDCHPENFPNQTACEARGCCWLPTKARTKPIHTGNPADPQAPVDVPYCYYPKDFPGYLVMTKEKTETGFRTILSRNSSSYYPKDIKNLAMDVSYETDTMLHFKIYDPNNKRYEVPIDLHHDPRSKSKDLRYKVIVSEPGEPFSITVTRVGQSARPPVFTTVGAAPLIFCDQFLQISSVLPSQYIYGLAEHRDSLLHSVNWTRFTMWNRDHGPLENVNLYGSHPFYVALEPGPRWSGVFLLNSNAMDIILQPAPAITYRTIGGVLDFYIFIDNVIPQYNKLIGTSFMPPYWSLGFHQCRFGYKTVNATMAVVDRIRKYGVPQVKFGLMFDKGQKQSSMLSCDSSYSFSTQDVQWNDIDYAIGRKDFTTDLKNFGDQAAMVDELHRRGLRYVIITDPGISSNETPGSYPPFDMGKKMDIFVKNDSGQLLVGNVWTGPTVWPDFTHPSAQKYWSTNIKTFHDKVKFDGLWIDMNEVSNFGDGSLDACPHTQYDNPPYMPAVVGGHLYSRTMCASARQYRWRSYDVHNLYGLKETQATYEALKEARGKRPFVISRSSFPGQGHYGGIWTGDNVAAWHDIYRSISAILTMSMSGISMVGVDICGFGRNTTYELCLRWYQLGAFYPFSRSHNAIIVEKDQDPGAFDARFAGIVRKAYLTRYSLLPYLYSLFWWSNYAGEPVARPLWYGLNMEDTETYNNDRQFLWGDALMITPVLTENATSVTGYFPSYSVWYDFYTGKLVSKSTSGTGNYVLLEAPLDHINLHVRGGCIIPMQEPALTTTESRKNDFSLLVAVGAGMAQGELYWDDGDTIGAFQNGSYNHIGFHSDANFLWATVDHKGYDSPMVLKNVTFYGFQTKPSSMVLDKDKEQKFEYDSELKVLKVPELNPKPQLTDGFILQWKY